LARSGEVCRLYAIVADLKWPTKRLIPNAVVRNVSGSSARRRRWAR
jgi:hypothetical protein